MVYSKKVHLDIKHIKLSLYFPFGRVNL